MRASKGDVWRTLGHFHVSVGLVCSGVSGRVHTRASRAAAQKTSQCAARRAEDTATVDSGNVDAQRFPCAGGFRGSVRTVERERETSETRTMGVCVLEHYVFDQREISWFICPFGCVETGSGLKRSVITRLRCFPSVGTSTPRCSGRHVESGPGERHPPQPRHVFRLAASCRSLGGSVPSTTPGGAGPTSRDPR